METRPPPGPSGPVVLAFGPGSGAVVAYTAAARLHDEVEIGPEAGTPWTHAEVRERTVAGGTVCAVVLCPIPPGRHVLRARDGTRLASVDVRPGTVSEVRIDG